MPLLDQAVALVTEPPGSFVYHFVTLLALEAALFIAAGQWWRSRETPLGRLALAAALVLVARAALLVVALLAYYGIIASAAVLPPLDRAISTSTILTIGWALIFPRGARLAAALLVALLILTGLGYAASAILWFPAGEAGAAYNTTLQERIWEIAQVGLLFGCLTALIFRRPDDWGAAFGLLLTLLVGHTIHLLHPDNARSLAGAGRLAELGAMPLLAVAAYRRAVSPASRWEAPGLESAAAGSAGLDGQSARAGMNALSVAGVTAGAPTSAAATIPTVDATKVPGVFVPAAPAHPPARPAEKPRMALAVAAAPALAGLGTTLDPNRVCESITAAIGRLMLADLTLLISQHDAEGSADVVCVFDLIRERHLPGFALSIDEMPTLHAALAGERARPARLAPSAHAEELARLGRRLGSPSLGPGLVMPISAEGQLRAGLLVLSPYSGREWNADDQAVLSAVIPAVTSALLNAEKWSAFEQRLAALAAQLQEARAEAHGSRDRGERLTAAMQKTEAQLERETSRAETLAAQLQAESETGWALEAVIAERARMEGELRLALTQVAELTSRHGVSMAEKDQLREELSGAQRLAADLQVRAAVRPSPTSQPAGAEVIAAITQELRQPMSSITGYTDLLLGESVGIIGALQRKFLERVKTSIERMGTLLEDLIRVTAIDTGTLKLEPEAVDVAGVIEDAIMGSGAQFREKGITLRLDISDDLPLLKADRDAVYQIVSHLLANACLASALDGEVGLTASHQVVGDAGHLLLSVKDTGGGIPVEDQGRVFTRLYRADNPLIPGLGDTGVGLSIVKVLVEAHGGRIQVESEAGVGSTFNVLLPADGAGLPEA